MASSTWLPALAAGLITCATVASLSTPFVGVGWYWPVVSVVVERSVTLMGSWPATNVALLISDGAKFLNPKFLKPKFLNPKSVTSC